MNYTVLIKHFGKIEEATIAIAAFLGIVIEEIYLYSGFRKDSINTVDENMLITYRANISAMEKIKEWKSGFCNLYLDTILNKIPYIK